MKRIKKPKQTREKEKYTKSVTYTLPSLPLALAKGNYYSLFKTLTKKEKVMPMSPYTYVYLLICIKQIMLYPLVTILSFSLICTMTSLFELCKRFIVLDKLLKSA